jgi:group I intron endonuclease
VKYPRKVYAIRHNVTNRVYIGSSCHIDKRFAEHISALRAHRHPVEDMQADFDRYGDDFSLTILDHIGTEADKNKEYEWMKKNQSYIRGIGYNYNDRKWLGIDTEEEEPIVGDEEEKPTYELKNENEKELISMICNHEDPEKAALIASYIILGFVKAEEMKLKVQ